MNFPRFLSCFFVVSFCLVCVNLSGLDFSSSFLERTTDDVVLRQHFWVFRELPPGVVRDEPYNPEEVLEKYALYIMQLSVFGGRVTYTPSDKTRGIEEFFEFIPRYPIKEPDPGSGKPRQKEAGAEARTGALRRNTWNSDIQNKTLKTYLFETTNLNSVIYLDDTIYYLNGNTFYYHNNYGERKIITNTELQFNSDLSFGVYKK